MLVLNQTVVDETSKQLKRIKTGYILAIIVASMLLTPVLNMILGQMFFISILLGLIVFIKREIKKHYRDALLTTALYFVAVAFVINVVQNKVATLIVANKATEDPNYVVTLLIGLVIYVLVIVALILVSISASRFFEQMRQFNMMVRYQHSKAYGPVPFQLKPTAIEPSMVYERRNGTKKQLVSFIVRACIVITLYFSIMNVEIITMIAIIPMIIILQAVRSSIALNEAQFRLFVNVWFNFYLQCIFVISFGLLFFQEIRLGLKRLFKPQKFSFVFMGYGMSLVCIVIVTVLLKILHVEMPEQSKNQELIEQTQKMLPIISALGTVILAPISEELVFRQGVAELLYRIFDSFMTVPKKVVQDIAVVVAILVSGLLFGFIHVMNQGDYIAMIPYAVSGIVYTTIYFWSGRNVTVTIGVHMLNNLVATILTM